MIKLYKISSIPMPTTCTSCSASFEITDKDRAFYEAISPRVGDQVLSIPAPTHCPQCRNQRRMAWRNDRTFYKRKCDLTGDTFISMYDADTKFPVYKQDVWHGDDWNALDYGRDIDFSRPFFEQWAELRDQVPHWGVAISNCENSDYCNYCTDEKNCYLDIAAEGNEDCYYDLFVKNSKNCTDTTFAYGSTLIYESIQCYDSYNCTYSQYLENCSDCTLSFDLKGCKNCALCVNLRNQEYCILNQRYSKEEYQTKLAELNLSSYGSLQQALKLWQTMRIEKGVYRDMYVLNCENAVGNNIKNCKNCTFVWNATNCEDCSYLYDVLDAKDCQDMNYSLYDPESSYEIISTVGTKFCAFFAVGPYNVNCYYSQMCMSCTDCFGCVGLKKKQYCIFNKQYSQEEYERLLPQLVEYMRNTKEWGEFFPIEFSPHGYNETVAQEYMPLTQQEVQAKGWHWKEEKTEALQVEKVIPADKLPDSIHDIPDDILQWAVQCEVTGKPFRITKQELDFYRQLGIPIPHRCPDQRHKDRNALRNSRELHQRTCAETGEVIWTSYKPDKAEKVLSEAAYLEAIK